MLRCHWGRVAMLQLDLAKAFDRVSHEVLFAILQYCNVGSVIVDGVKMAYEDCYMQLIVNKCLSSRVPLRSSVRQGCPLSPLLFALYLEPFCMAVIRNENIRGFRLHAAEVKMLAYADDVAVFCEDRESVVEAVRLARSFCRYTGAQINFEKSVGIWHGSWDATPTKFAGMQWTTVPPLYLGVPLEHYRDSTQLWTGQIESMKEKIKGWQGRGLSVFARASACNIFLIAKVWYILQVMFMSRVNVQKCIECLLPSSGTPLGSDPVEQIFFAQFEMGALGSHTCSLDRSYRGSSSCEMKEMFSSVRSFRRKWQQNCLNLLCPHLVLSLERLGTIVKSLHLLEYSAHVFRWSTCAQ